MEIAAFPQGTNTLGPEGGVADDADSTRMIPSIPDGFFAVVGSLGSFFLFRLACGGCHSSGYTWCYPEDKPDSGSHRPYGRRLSGPEGAFADNAHRSRMILGSFVLPKGAGSRDPGSGSVRVS